MDAALVPAFKEIADVDQALCHLLSDDLWATCIRVARGEEPMKSTLELYFDPSPEPGKNKNC